MRVIREALQRARNQLNLYTDQVWTPGWSFLFHSGILR
jgi:hypothetical protein